MRRSSSNVYENIYNYEDPVSIKLDLGWMSRDLTKSRDVGSIKLSFPVNTKYNNVQELSHKVMEELRIKPFHYMKYYVLPESISMDVPALRITIDGVVRTGLTQCKGTDPAAAASHHNRKILTENLCTAVKDGLLENPLIRNSFMNIELKEVYCTSSNMLRAKISVYLFLLQMKRDNPSLSAQEFKQTVQQLLNSRTRKFTADRNNDRTKQRKTLTLPKTLILKTIVLEANLAERMKMIDYTSPIFPKCTFQRAGDVFNAPEGDDWLYQANWYHCLFIFGNVYKKGENVHWMEKYRDPSSPEYKDVETDITTMVTEALRSEDLINTTWQNCELMDLYPNEDNYLSFQMRVGLKDDELLLENFDIATEDYARVIRNRLLKRGLEVHAK